MRSGRYEFMNDMRAVIDQKNPDNAKVGGSDQRSIKPDAGPDRPPSGSTRGFLQHPQ